MTSLSAWNYIYKSSPRVRCGLFLCNKLCSKWQRTSVWFLRLLQLLCHVIVQLLGSILFGRIKSRIKGQVEATSWNWHRWCNHISSKIRMTSCRFSFSCPQRRGIKHYYTQRRASQLDCDTYFRTLLSINIKQAFLIFKLWAMAWLWVL